MYDYTLPHVCPFCNKDHAVDILKLQLSSQVKCAHCHKTYIIPYSEIKKLVNFYDSLKSFIDSR